ncbi:MAG: urate hydroxylase PuuD [Bdellovibrionales bacterium]
MLQSLANIQGLHFLFRWLHLFFGIMWIGLLYYFNYVQGAFMAETTEAVAKSQVVQKLLPRAMWWFRWGAMWTFVSGLLMLMINAHLDMSAAGVGVFSTPPWINILTGAFFGTLMFLNVWLIIHPKQKIVIANAVNVASGKPADPAAAVAAGKALLASRTNTMFSIPLLFFMVAKSHLGFAVTDASQVCVYWIVATLIILGLEANGIFGKTGPIATIKGVITAGFALTAVFVILLSVLM